MFRIKELRIKMGLNMKEAARQLNMPYTTYVNYEKGHREPTSEILIQLADFFGSSIDYLVGRNSSVSNNVDNVPNKSDSVSELRISPPEVIGPVITAEELDLIRKFRRLDDRGKSAVLNVLDHEYDALPGKMASSAPRHA